LSKQEELCHFILEEGISIKSTTTVWRSKLRVNNQYETTAAKSVPISINNRARLEREFENWQLFDHPNIAKLFCAIQTEIEPKQVVFFTELGMPLTW
jgi:hypothetical protein